ncbi:MAG: Rieske 2Fe-2S domain-containing protein [Betaproteobacteria bacterium]|nr:Rieske 2Fe-2S domain-containing protein [Betaproteobacteria bacterium]
MVTIRPSSHRPNGGSSVAKKVAKKAKGTVLCKADAVPADGLLQCAAGSLKVCVARSGKDFYAFQSECPHKRTPLCDGALDGHVLTCLDHMWQWDIRSGEPEGLAEQPIRTFKLRRDGDSLVLVE